MGFGAAAVGCTPPPFVFEAVELATGAFSKICEAGLLAPAPGETTGGSGSADVAGAGGPMACLFCCEAAPLPAVFVPFGFGAPRPGVLADGGFDPGLTAPLFGEALAPAPDAGIPALPAFGCELLPLPAAAVDGATVGLEVAGSVPVGIEVEAGFEAPVSAGVGAAGVGGATCATCTAA